MTEEEKIEEKMEREENFDWAIRVIMRCMENELFMEETKIAEEIAKYAGFSLKEVLAAIRTGRHG